MKMTAVMETFLRHVFLILCIVIFLLGIYSVKDNANVYKQTDQSSYRKREQAEEESDKDAGPVSIITWLHIEDTSIDYPVMQSEDNVRYLSCDPAGSFSLAGSIFLDYRNQDDYSDPYCILYGHHMDGQSMFGVLDEYYDQDYFYAHQKGVLCVGGKERDLFIFAIADENASDPMIYDPLNADVKSILVSLKENAAVYDENALPQKTLIALSTCSAAGYDNARTVVFAWLT